MKVEKDTFPSLPIVEEKRPEPKLDSIFESMPKLGEEKKEEATENTAVVKKAGGRGKKRPAAELKAGFF